MSVPEILAVNTATVGFDYVIEVTEKVVVVWTEQQFDPMTGRTVEVTMSGRETRTREVARTPDPDAARQIADVYRRSIRRDGP